MPSTATSAAIVDCTSYSLSSMTVLSCGARRTFEDAVKTVGLEKIVTGDLSTTELQRAILPQHQDLALPQVKRHLRFIQQHKMFQVKTLVAAQLLEMLKSSSLNDLNIPRVALWMAKTLEQNKQFSNIQHHLPAPLKLMSLTFIERAAECYCVASAVKNRQSLDQLIPASQVVDAGHLALTVSRPDAWRSHATQLSHIEEQLTPAQHLPADILDQGSISIERWQQLNDVDLRLGARSNRKKRLNFLMQTLNWTNGLTFSNGKAVSPNLGELVKAQVGQDDRLITQINQGLSAVSHNLWRHFPKLKDNPDSTQTALDNAMTMFITSIAVIDQVKLTPAIVAFSALYPLTDELIDHPDISLSDKMQFFKLFKQKIETGLPNRQELKNHSLPQTLESDYDQIWLAFEMIESQLDRRKHLVAYECMSALHDAQLESKEQNVSPEVFDSIKATTEAYQAFNDKISRITLRKGGLSGACIIALVSGNPTPMQLRFASDLVSVTQLLNDYRTPIEDVENEAQYTSCNLAYLRDVAARESNSSQQKLITQHTDRNRWADKNKALNELDRFVVKTFQLMDQITQDKAYRYLLTTPSKKRVVEWFQEAIKQEMIMLSMTKHREAHSQTFLNQLHAYSDVPRALYPYLKPVYQLRRGAISEESVQALRRQIISIQQDYRQKWLFPRRRIQNKPSVN